MVRYFTESNFADIVGVSKATVQKWISNGVFGFETDKSGNRVIDVLKLQNIPEIKEMIEEMKMIYAPGLEEAVQMAKAMGKESITVIPNGVSVIVKE